MPKKTHRLLAEHRPEAVRQRLSAKHRHSYLGDGVLGAIDGCVTTFAVVAGVVGGGLSATVALILGFANLLADGFSMAVSNYQATLADRELLGKTRREEERHVELVPGGEREEIRQIFANKGFDGENLEHIVEVITSDKKLWVDTMLREEHGLTLTTASPVRAAAATFGAFCAAGLVPLLPFVVYSERAAHENFPASIGVTALTFLGIGLLKGYATDVPKWRAGLGTLALGGAAASIAYGVGALLRRLVGV